MPSASMRTSTAESAPPFSDDDAFPPAAFPPFPPASSFPAPLFPPPAGSSSLSGAKGVGSPLRRTATYAPYDGSAWALLRLAQPLARPRSVLARK